MALTKIINSDSKSYRPVLTDKLVLDDVPTVNSFNSVTSDAVARAIAGASGEVPQVTENDNGKVLTAVYDEGGAAVEWAEAQGGGSSYTAGTGISISEQNEISVTETIENGAAAGATALQPSALEAYTPTASLSTVATSGDYDDLQNKPTIPAAQVNADWDAASGVAQILNKPTIPTVDQNYSASSTNAQSGTAVAQAVAGISVDEVPAVTSSDDGKVLTASYSGGQGSYSWETAQGGGGSSYTAGDGIKIESDVLSVNAGDGLKFVGTETEPANLASPVGQTGASSFGYKTLGQLSSTAVAALKSGVAKIKLLFDYTITRKNAGVYVAIAYINNSNGPESSAWMIANEPVDTGTSGSYTFSANTELTADFSSLNTKSTLSSWATIEATPAAYCLALVTFTTTSAVTADSGYAQHIVGSSASSVNVIEYTILDNSHRTLNVDATGAFALAHQNISVEAQYDSTNQGILVPDNNAWEYIPNTATTAYNPNGKQSGSSRVIITNGSTTEVLAELTFSDWAVNYPNPTHVPANHGGWFLKVQYVNSGWQVAPVYDWGAGNHFERVSEASQLDVNTSDAVTTNETGGVKLPAANGSSRGYLAIPSFSSTESGKSLSVDNSGALVWSTAAAGSPVRELVATGTGTTSSSGQQTDITVTLTASKAIAAGDVLIAELYAITYDTVSASTYYNVVVAGDSGAASGIYAKGAMYYYGGNTLGGYKLTGSVVFMPYTAVASAGNLYIKCTDVAQAGTSFTINVYRLASAS